MNDKDPHVKFWCEKFNLHLKRLNDIYDDEILILKALGAKSFTLDSGTVPKTVHEYLTDGLKTMTATPSFYPLYIDDHKKETQITYKSLICPKHPTSNVIYSQLELRRDDVITSCVSLTLKDDEGKSLNYKINR